MKKLGEYLICIVFGVAIGFGPYYFATKEILNRPTVQNSFKKIKTKGESTTSVDVSTLVEEETKERKWKLFKK